MFEAAHRHAAQQVGLGELQPGIDDRGDQDHRQPQDVNGDRDKPTNTGR